jgi:hypothetical protein
MDKENKREKKRIEKNDRKRQIEKPKLRNTNK